MPDGQAADDTPTVVAGSSAVDDTTWLPAGEAPPDGAVAWPDGAGGGPGDGASGSPEGADWPSEGGDWRSEGADWRFEGAGAPPEEEGWPSEDASLTGTVPEGPELTGAPAGSYRGRRRRRRSFGQVATVAAVVGLVLLGTGVIVHWAGTTGEGSLGPPPRPDPVPTVPVSPDDDRPVTPDGGVSSGPDDRHADAGPGEGRDGDGGSGEDRDGDAGSGEDPDGDGGFEAENGALARGASVEALAAASGGQVVRLSPHASVELSVTVDEPGTYQLTVYYAATTSYSAEVSINGGQSVTVEFPALDPGVIGTLVLNVALAGGENTVTVARPDRPGLMLDRITVTG